MASPFEQLYPDICAWNTDTRLTLALEFIQRIGHMEHFDRWVDVKAYEELRDSGYFEENWDDVISEHKDKTDAG